MLSLSKDILGKRQGDKTLPLVYHLFDVALVADVLWDKWLSAEIKGEIESKFPQARSFLQLSCLLHDLGKASKDFQGQLETGKRPKESLDHVTLSCFMLSEYVKRNINARRGRSLFEQGFLREVISYHHGIQATQVLTNSKPKDSDNVMGLNENEICTRFISFDGICAYIGSALEELNLSKDILTLPYKKIPFYIRDLLSGLLILSDWIGSTEMVFPYDDLPYEERKKNALSKLTPLLSQSRMKDFSTVDLFFRDVFGFAPNALQASMFSVDIDSKKLVFIEAPTGHGKTEASLALAYRYCKVTGRGLYYAMPTRATSNALYPRLSSYTRAVNDNPELCKLYHSKADLFFYSHADMEDQDEDETVLDQEYILKNKLTSAMRHIIGTTDHVLKMCMNVKHFPMHHACLVNHVIVFDEVHSYDARMFSCLCASLAFLSRYDVPVVILSATMPDDKRSKLVDAYGRERSLCINAYPKGEGVEDDGMTVRVKEKEKHKEVSFSLDLQPEYCPSTDHEKDAMAIIGKIKEYGCRGFYGIVVNTVDRSQAFYDLFKQAFGMDHVTLLHSRMEAMHREEVEKGLIQSLGKDGFTKRKEGGYFKAVIATQIVEQSIDIDFDCLFTDLCPMDALIQRVGRLHRHSQNGPYRPEPLHTPQFYVMQAYSKNPDGDITDLSKCSDRYAELIYPPYLLYATYAELVSLNGRMDTVTGTEGAIKAVFTFNKGKTLLGKDLSYPYHEYCSEIKEDEGNAYADMFAKSCSLVEFKREVAECNLLYGGLNETKGADVRDTLASLEVVLLNRAAGADGKFVYSSCYDGSIITKFTRDETGPNTISLPTKVIHKCNGVKNLRGILHNDKPKGVYFNHMPYLVFDMGEPKPLESCKGTVNLWYDREKGLVIE